MSSAWATAASVHQTNVIPQEAKHSFAEAVVSGVTSVMGHGFVHQPPEALDRVQRFRQVSRQILSGGTDQPW
jgi:hypothetical protein